MHEFSCDCPTCRGAGIGGAFEEPEEGVLDCCRNCGYTDYVGEMVYIDDETYCLPCAPRGNSLPMSNNSGGGLIESGIEIPF